MTEEERRPWWRRRPPIRRVLMIAGAVLLGGFVWLWWQGVPALYRSAELAPGTKLTAADQLKAITDTRTALLAGLAAAGALGTFFVNARTQRFTADTLRISEKNFLLTERGHITDRYTKAIEQLGNDNLDVRLGGIYALEQLATDSPEDRRDRDQATIVEVLSAFVRVHSNPLPEDAPPEPTEQQRQKAAEPTVERKRPPVDVQAAVTVLGRLPLRRGIQRADLSEANLAGASLLGADLAGANLLGANLTEALLLDATLTGADLHEANLTGADLHEANLTGASLHEANLTEANLIVATLTEADLDGANLTGADLHGANLTEADLHGAILTGASPDRADLNRASLREADLGTTKGVAQEQLNGAIGNERTVLPPGLQRPESWSESEGQEPD